MKKIIVVLLTLVLLGSCRMVYGIIDDITLAQIGGQELYNHGFPEMETYEEVAEYVKSVLTFEDMKLNPICSPEKAIKEGRGNCTTFAILFINVAHFTLDTDFGLASVTASGSSQRYVTDGGFPDHSVVILGGQLYSAYRGTPITEYNTGYYYTFHQIFN